MIIPRLALRNILGARVRTWLNVLVLSFAFVAIIIFQGLYKGLDEQASQAKIETECGGGQYWHARYDAYDSLSLDEAHGAVPEILAGLVRRGDASPILITHGTIYPSGRVLPVLLKGIDPAQKILSIPAGLLERAGGPDPPAVIGRRMAKAAGLKVGDTVTVRWREAGGAFNALDFQIVLVMSTSNPGIDNGQIWLPLERLRTMTRMEGRATILVLRPGVAGPPRVPGWEYKDLDFLLQDIRSLVHAKTVGGSILYFFMLVLAMLAIFDTQVLSVFRRRKEIGTMMAMGMTRTRIIGLFTMEGALHAVLAAFVGALYGIPLAAYLVTRGWALPESMDSYGYALGRVLFPVYSVGLVLGTTVLVLAVTTFVSYLPARKISRMKPTEALKGKLP